MNFVIQSRHIKLEHFAAFLVILSLILVKVDDITDSVVVSAL